MRRVDGLWVVHPATAAADWQLAVAAMAASVPTRAATVVLNHPADDPAPDRPGVRALREADVATRLRVRSAAVEDLGTVARALRRTHGLVLVVALPGAGPAAEGVTLTPAALAAALAAPMMLVAEASPDLAERLRPAFDESAERSVPAWVLVVGEGPAPAQVAGRIPADVPVGRDEFAAAARSWLRPAPPPHPDRPDGNARNRIWICLVLGLGLVALLVCYGLRSVAA